MNNPRVAPVRIIDRNGKQTTVHRRTGAPTAAASPLAAARPVVAPAATGGPRDHETTVIDAGVPDLWWTKRMRVLDPEAPHPTGGEVTLTNRDAYRYLALGLALTDAAMLHSSVPYPTHWEEQPEVVALGRACMDSLHSGGANGDGVAEAVAFMRAAGTSPKAVAEMLQRGFSDRHVAGVLDARQLLKVYRRLSYSRAAMAGHATRSTNLLDRLIDGSLPFDVIEREYRKGVLMNAADFLFDPKARAKEGGTAEDAQTMLADRPALLAALAVMDAHAKEGRNGVPLKKAWQAAEMFGEEHASAHQLGVSVPRDLTLAGSAAIADAVRKGYPVEKAAALLRDDALTAEQAVAAITGETSSALATGWL